MTMVREITEKGEWDNIVERFHGHPLQLWGWGEVKARHGWQIKRVVVENAHNREEIIGGAQLLIKTLPWPFKALVYVPRGPFTNGSHDQALAREISLYAKRTWNAVLVKIEPDTANAISWPEWQKTSQRILLARTAVMDLTKSEDELLADMTKKTRQYVRKSAGEGITVTTATSQEQITACLEIYKQTAKRAGFGLHGDKYYFDIFNLLERNSPVYLAEYDGRVVAFLWPIVTSEVAFELYGGMNDEGQRLRANYHLKWSVIQAMKARGVKRYDVNGLLNDGVTTFKKGFIPDETLMAGTYDRPLSVWYPVWNTLLPFAKQVVQRVRR